MKSEQLAGLLYGPGSIHDSDKHRGPISPRYLDNDNSMSLSVAFLTSIVAGSQLRALALGLYPNW